MRVYNKTAESGVSIHAFRGEGDHRCRGVRYDRYVSIHAFRGEGDASVGSASRKRSAFQSTPSGGKATGSAGERRGQRRFNPRLPGGRRPRKLHNPNTKSGFQSTPSGGKATHNATVFTSDTLVSIHAFRGEGDVVRIPCSRPGLQFQSTPSGGKATMASAKTLTNGLFQSTPSGGKATDGERQDAHKRVVSIHAFRGEGDTNGLKMLVAASSFNPRLPGGRRPREPGAAVASTGFNPRLPGGRRPRSAGSAHIRLPVSIHAFRGEGDICSGFAVIAPQAVSIHAFRGEGDSNHQ